MRRLPIIMSLGLATGAAVAAGIEVHQADRQFLPAQLTVAKGSIVHFVNDEAIVHHAFVDTRDFAVDSGDIPPGESRDIVFTQTGAFVVRCAIHPAMRLSVQVGE